MIFLSILIFILAMSLSFFKTQITPIFFTRIAALSFIYAGVLSYNALNIHAIGSGIGIFSGYFQVTYFSLFIETFLYIVAALILLSWALKKDLSFNRPINLEVKSENLYFSDMSVSSNLNLLEEKISSVGTESKEYSLIALFSTLGGSFLLSSGDLLSMYLSIELQSFGLYILATLYRDSRTATGAGLKYFLLGGLSSCLILLGAALIYSFTGLTNLESIYSLISVLSINTLPGMFLNFSILPVISLGLILIVVGFLFKIAAAPFHNWAPDVYDESPTNVTIWLTIMPKISIVIFLLELVLGFYSQITLPVLNTFVFNGPDSIFAFAEYLSNGDVRLSSVIQEDLLSLSLDTSILGGSAYVLKNLFLISSLISLILGTVVGLAQIKIKRLLAYSTISHVGFLLLALAINTEQSTESLLLYLIQYIITTVNTFFILLAFGYIINSSRQSSRLNSYSFSGSNSKSLTNNRITHNSDIKYIFDLKGQFTSNPILSLSLAICLFSMAGIPPLIGFFGKQSVLYAAISNGYIFMALLAIVLSVISAYYYLRVIRELHSLNIKEPLLINRAVDKEEKVSLEEIVKNENVLNSETKESNQSILYLTNIHSFIISTITLSILFFVLKPSILLNSTVLLSLSLFNG